MGLNKGVCVGHDGSAQWGEIILAVGAGAELTNVGIELTVPLFPISEGLGAQAWVLQKGADYCQLRLFGLEETLPQLGGQGVYVLLSGFTQTPSAIFHKTLWRSQLWATKEPLKLLNGSQ